MPAPQSGAASIPRCGMAMQAASAALAALSTLFGARLRFGPLAAAGLSLRPTAAGPRLLLSTLRGAHFPATAGLRPPGRFTSTADLRLSCRRRRWRRGYHGVPLCGNQQFFIRFLFQSFIAHRAEFVVLFKVRNVVGVVVAELTQSERHGHLRVLVPFPCPEASGRKVVSRFAPRPAVAGSGQAGDRNTTAAFIRTSMRLSRQSGKDRGASGRM